MVPTIGRAAKALADCAWLDAQRARAYPRILLAMTLIGAVGWIALSPGGLDREGKPIGTDFIGFYAASRLALGGRPELGYHVGSHWAAQKALFGPKLGYTAFFYPPPALLISLPLALAPYFWSLAAWLATTGYAFYRVLRFYLPSLDIVVFLAFPAVFVNAAHGQNGFLSAALIGGGLMAIDRRPMLAGVLFGAMAFKPQLALVIPFALIFAHRWTTLIVAAATAAAFTAASLAAFGAPAWEGFFTDGQFARSALENDLIGNEKMQGVFAAVRLLHGSLALAWGAQIATALGVIAALWRLQRRDFRRPAEAAATVCAGLLASPFLLDYDLTLIEFPLVWLFREGRRTGFLPFEKLLLAVAFVLPLVLRAAAGALGLPLAPLIIGAIFAFTLRRALTPAPGSAGRALQTNAKMHLSPARTVIGRCRGHAPITSMRQTREGMMAAAPGKSCGACTMCCSALEIAHFKKPAGPLCANCRPGGGCAIYAERPQVCRDFECEWLTRRDLPRQLRPDLVGTILMEDADSDEYRAVCAPERPMAWRHPLVFAHLVAVAKSGRTVVAKAGLTSWRIFGSGEWGPTV